MTQAEIIASGASMAEDMETPSVLHDVALFNPVKENRIQAWKQLRARTIDNDESPVDGRFWLRADRAARARGPEAELTADAGMTVDSWQEYADTILDDQFVESTIIDQLIGAGFGVPTSLFRFAYFDRLRATRMEADRSMNARSRSTQELPAHGIRGIPLWIHHVDWEFDSREFQNAQMFGDDLDPSVAREARRAINRSEHRLLWDGEETEVPTDRGSLAATGLDEDNDLILGADNSTGWINDGEEILADFDELHDTLESQDDVIDEDDVPLVSEVGGRVFVPRGMWGEVTREDYETEATDEPVIERIQRKYPYLEITPAPRLDDDSAIMMLDDTRYFQIVVAQGVTNTNWEVDGGFGLRNKTLASRTPFVRRSPDGIRGIVRMTGINQ